MQGLVRRMPLKERLKQAPPAIWVLLLMIAFFASREATFLTIGNLLSMLRQGSILIILCMGVAFVRIGGGIDLSVGAVMTLSGMIIAWLLAKASMPMFPAILLALLAGLCLGMLNGFFVTKMRIPSFIATLGTQGIAFGISLGMNKGYVISGLPSSFEPLGHGLVLGLPIPIWFALFAILLSFILLNLTQFGVYVYAIGGNEDALTLAGKPSWKYKAMTFGYAGFMSGLAAIVITARTMAAQPTVGSGMEFEAFFATVLGGVFAGRGGIFETMLGVLFILVLRNGLNLMGVPTYLQLAIIGTVLILGIIFSTIIDRRFRR